MNFAEHLKSRLDIVDVIGEYVRLKRQGSSHRYVGLCPFHSEKTPSFHVNGALQFYKCFGCDARGDIFQFVQTLESLTFPETLRLLAEKNGIEVPARQRTDDLESQLYAAMLEAHEAAAELFQENLRASGNAETRAYLQSRGVSAATAAEFRLGFSDRSGQQLVNRLKRFGDSVLESAGLISRREDGTGRYDRFRGRLMFPIHDANGKVIAFGARAMDPQDKVKYLNSPATKLYNKSAVLYNFHRAKIDARKNDRMILVEGYMDAIGIYAAGVREVVAVCGTKLSIEQVRAIKREISHQSKSGQVILNLDPDPAGTSSSEKHIETLLAEHLRVRVLDIPQNLDPDEYVQKNGAEAYRALLSAAPSYFHWLTDRARERFDPRTAEGRIDAFKMILPAIEKVGDRLERAAIKREVAESLKVDREIVSQVLRVERQASPVRSIRDVASAVPPNEKLLLACMLAASDARVIIAHYLADESKRDGLELRSLFETLLAHCGPEGSFDLSQAEKALGARDGAILASITFSDYSIDEEQAIEQALHCLRALEAKNLAKRCEALRSQIREMEAAGKFVEALDLSTQLDQLKRSA